MEDGEKNIILISRDFGEKTSFVTKFLIFFIKEIIINNLYLNQFLI